MAPAAHAGPLVEEGDGVGLGEGFAGGHQPELMVEGHQLVAGDSDGFEGWAHCGEWSGLKVDVEPLEAPNGTDLLQEVRPGLSAVT